MNSFILLYFLPMCLCHRPEEVTYVVNLDSQMEICDETSAAFVNTSGVRVDRYNETIAYMDGEIEFFNDIGVNTMVEVILKKETSGKYELWFSHEIWDFCGEITKAAESDYYNHLKYIGFPESCPFPAGKYPINEMIISTDDMPLNSNTCGRYQAYLNLYNVPDEAKPNNREFLFCLYMKLIIEME